MRMVQRGDRGEDVKYLQQLLTRHGYHLLDDGIFGWKTLSAVHQFQQAQGLKVDGYVGDRTWDALLVIARERAHPKTLGLQKAELRSEMRFQQIRSRLDPEEYNDKVRPVLITAIDQIGLKEVPDGSNEGPEIGHIVDGYWEARGVTENYPSPPWCAIFVSWCLKEGLDKSSWAYIPFGQWFGGVQEIVQWAEARGVYMHHQGEPLKVEPGVIFTMNRGQSSSDAAGTTRAGHCGFVVAAETVNSVIYYLTVEGNVSNQVMMRRRRPETLSGLVRWWE